MSFGVKPTPVFWALTKILLWDNQGTGAGKSKWNLRFAFLFRCCSLKTWHICPMLLSLSTATIQKHKFKMKNECMSLIQDPVVWISHTGKHFSNYKWRSIHVELASTIWAVSHPGLLCYTQPQQPSHLPPFPTKAAISQISGHACGQQYSERNWTLWQFLHSDDTSWKSLSSA